MKKKKALLYSLLALLLLGSLVLGTGYYLALAPQFHPTRESYVYIDADDTMDSVLHKLSDTSRGGNITALEWAARYKGYDRHVRTGRYLIAPGDNVYQVFTRLYRGHQTPLPLTIGNTRTVEQLAGSVGRRLMIDSTEIVRTLIDTDYLAGMGYDERTLPALFVPDTYEVYWNISAEQFFERMRQEHDRFWNTRRLEQATAIGLSEEEVCTLASIVEEETNKNDEKPIVAGLYINRLRKGMPLQADPTIKFALGNFALRRVTNDDLKVDSPYNTYTHTGLPPGPIRIASKQGIESVLDYARHNYLYMCAKEDFSGYHNFASNLADHLENARKYQKALNERKIFR
ncbi:MAG: endolytic transglycosylase MltG [Mediterranea sp.]|jgi:UPF0755 protein|nr:endolytic transglycosylase MltG [Mediterranea sp.]